MLLVGVPLICWGERLWVMYPWLEPVAPVLSALVMAVMFQDSFRREAENLLRQHWASLNGGAEKRIVVTKKELRLLVVSAPSR